ncbi:MAG: redoxin domain-containing protein [Spirochaetes bacterium]|nr:redoxin domain-containing protein [Spirochaetota bacterium]
MPLKAIEFPKNATWLNTKNPLYLQDLHGTVVLLCFWNFFAPACIRAMEELRTITDIFSDHPFVIIYIHSSHFGESIIPEHISHFALRYSISHPILIDNSFETWNNYGINDWPSFVIIDAESNIMGSVAGEGKAERIKLAIEKALDDGTAKGILLKQRPQFSFPYRSPSLLSIPSKLEIDAEKGHLFISDTAHHRILHVQLERNNSARIIAEYGGKAGFNDGKTIRASFRFPLGLCYANNILYVADSGNHAIRAIHINEREVTTIAGTGHPGFSTSYSGNPQKISLNLPSDIATSGEYLYIALAGLNQIWQLDIENNYLTNFIGSGLEGIFDGSFSASSLAKPYALAFHSNALYIADANSSAIRVADLSAHLLTTLIGKGLYDFGYIDGHFSDARLLHPTGIEVIKSRMFIADTYNNAIRFCEIPGTIIRSLISKNPDSTLCIAEKETLTPLNEPSDIVYYKGKLYIADSGNHLIRVYDMAQKTLIDLDIS